MTKDLTLIDVVSNLESFGNKNLIENARQVEQALSRTEPLQSIFNHSHSQFAWKHLTLSYLSPHRNLRQIAAELARKRDALWEAKWRCVERTQDVKELKEELEDLNKSGRTIGIRRRELELQKKLEEQQMSIKSIEGAMKDILSLTAFYDDLCKKHNIQSEEEFEKQEAWSHLCRALSQSIRDMRQTGRISVGNQEYLEQIGINPSRVYIKLNSYLENEVACDDWTVNSLHEFVVNLAEELAPLAEERMKLMGYRPDLVLESLS